MTPRMLVRLVLPALVAPLILLGAARASAQSPTAAPVETATAPPAQTQPPAPPAEVEREEPTLAPAPGITETDEDDDGLPTGLIVALIVLGVVAVLAIFAMLFRPDRRPGDPREPL